MINLKKELEKDRKFLADLASKAAKKAYLRMVKNQFENFYLYFRPSTQDSPGKLDIASDSETPDRFQLAWAEQIPRNSTEEQIRIWINEKTQKLPIMPWD